MDINESKTIDVKGVEIFKTGTWNGDKYTIEDIDEIVKAHDEVGGQIKPFIKLGHSENQKLLQEDGYPAAGWVTNLRRVGEALVADFLSMPKKIGMLIQNKAIGRFSSEIYWNLKSNGKTYKRALKAVALLGANTPAVSTLDDFINLYITENECDYEILKVCSDLELTNDKEFSMDIDVKKYQDQIDELSSKVREYTAENEELVVEVEKLNKYIEGEKESNRKENVKAYIENAVKENKILPSQVEKYVGLAKDDDSFELVKNIIENNPDQVDFSEDSTGEALKKKEEVPADVKLHRDAIEYLKENKLEDNSENYKLAIIEVANQGEV